MISKTNIQVFIDLENIQPPFAEARARKRLVTLLEGIGRYLQLNDYKIEHIWACARERVPKETKSVIDTVFGEFGGVMIWTRNVIADIEIQRELMNRSHCGTLSPAILFISSDNDFVEVLLALQAGGTEVLVSGINVGRRLQQIANRVVPFVELN